MDGGGGGVILRLFYDGILFNGIHSSVKYYENSLVMIEVNIFFSCNARQHYCSCNTSSDASSDDKHLCLVMISPLEKLGNFQSRCTINFVLLVNNKNEFILSIYVY